MISALSHLAASALSGSVAITPANVTAKTAIGSLSLREERVSRRQLESAGAPSVQYDSGERERPMRARAFWKAVTLDLASKFVGRGLPSKAQPAVRCAGKPAGGVLGRGSSLGM